MPPMLVLATRNRKKRGEIVEILGDLGLQLGDLTEFPNVPEVVEDGETFEDNARKKAVEVARATGHWTLGEDSGLEVPALKNRPDEANNDRLLAELAPLPDDQRTARYVCTAALSDPTGDVKAVVKGFCYGVIIKERRGTGGFGYDPLFLIPEYHQTFGELSSRVKHALSHRARALAQLRPYLRQYLLSPAS
jgi:XTP/dITP diphosphohydrolase